MKHYVLGLVFNKDTSRILLIKKKRPTWMEGFWNGIGGKIEDNETPKSAMDREMLEEIGQYYKNTHVMTFTCPGGTVYVFKAICNTEDIIYKQIEDEILKTTPINDMLTPYMTNLKWIIPLSLSSVQFPIIIQQNEIGVL